MTTRTLRTATPPELERAIATAVDLLARNQPVALPTETVYGLAARALDRDALLRIFQTKERPLFDPLIVHLPDRLCDIAAKDRPLVEKLAARFWPGPLTFVLPRKVIVPDLATAGLPTVAVRMSAHPVFKAVIERFGQPLAAPSANRFGRISPTDAAHVAEELDGRIELIVDGGPARHGIESTIVAVRDGGLWIQRSGPVTADELREFAEVNTMPRDDRRPNAPGMLKSHYAPSIPLRLLPQGERPQMDFAEPVGLLAFASDEGAGKFRRIEVLSRSGDLREAAATLFAKLRALDAPDLREIIAESVPERGLGIAIMDRLRKASGNG
jgi:L-threonylcarbamoyladenylate synthase